GGLREVMPVTQTLPSERSTRRQRGDQLKLTVFKTVPPGEIFRIRLLLCLTSGCSRSATQIDPSGLRSTETAHHRIRSLISRRTVNSRSHFLIVLPTSHKTSRSASRTMSKPLFVLCV